jgi:CBS domain-containing protein
VAWVGDLVVEAVVCRLDATLAEARGLVAMGDADFCVVVNDERIVAGVLRGDALAKTRRAGVADVMEPGPRTIRPGQPVEKLLAKRSSQGVKSWIVTTAHGELVGVVLREDAERALEDAATRAR